MAQLRVRFDLRFGPRTSRLFLIVGMLLTAVSELESENVTLTTYYPAPSGAYTQMITTGNTYLARDMGSVGVGTATPANKLDVNGTVGANKLQLNDVVTAETACSPNGLVAREAAGSIVSCVGGAWKSLAGGTLVQMYQCPGPVTLGGGAWGYYGCQNQITNTPTCYEMEWPTTQTFNCTPIGKMALY